MILVDKPDAAQSVIMIGGPGMSRTDPDYPAVMVMNTILGGSFSSRLNDLLREQLGYTYGAGSDFSFAPVAGPFMISTDVRTDVTDSSLAVIFREITAMRDAGRHRRRARPRTELPRPRLALGLRDRQARSPAP